MDLDLSMLAIVKAVPGRLESLRVSRWASLGLRIDNIHPTIDVSVEIYTFSGSHREMQ